jgi:putative tryptophan/tyrosine transport system substrate-binding protein
VLTARAGDVTMRLCAVIVVIALSMVLAPVGGQAQPTGSVARVGLLTTNVATGLHLIVAFREGLRDLGYVEGRSLVLEMRDAGGVPERLPALAAELVALKVDVLVTSGRDGALAARQATTTVPVVAAVVGDPVGLGLVKSVARPGGNMTGFSNMAPDLVAKCLEQLKHVVPHARRVAVLRQRGELSERSANDMLRNAEAAGRTLGVQIQGVDVRGPDDFIRAFADMSRGRAEALLVLGSPMLFRARARLVEMAAQHRLPAVYQEREFVHAGGLMAYGADYVDMFRGAATYVDKILKGAKPGDLPVVQPTKFELFINARTARALGLTIPPSVLARTHHIID